jgi:hypothetical protein
VVGGSAFVAVSIPVSALHGFDDDGDGRLGRDELARHQPELRDEVDRRLSVLSGGRAATTVRIDLVLSPDHDSTAARAEQLVVLEHARLASAASDEVHLETDLFGAGERERELTITGTRHSSADPSAVTTEVAILRPSASGHTFFRAPSAPFAVPSDVHDTVLRGLALTAAALLAALLASVVLRRNALRVA